MLALMLQALRRFYLDYGGFGMLLKIHRKTKQRLNVSGPIPRVLEFQLRTSFDRNRLSEDRR